MVIKLFESGASDTYGEGLSGTLRSIIGSPFASMGVPAAINYPLLSTILSFERKSWL